VFDEGRFDGVVAGCNDFAAFTVARISDARGLANFDSSEKTRKIHHKDVFRQLALDLKLNSPTFFMVSSVAEASMISQSIEFPVIVKPTDLTGGKGVSVVHDMSALGVAAEEALARSRSKRVVVESFVTGSLRSALFVVLGGVTHLVVSADEFMYLNPFLVASAVSTTGESPETWQGLAKQVCTVVSALELADGLIHVQYIWSGTDFTILEICRRPPGDLYLMLAEFASGYNICEALVHLALGELVDPPENLRPSKSVFRLCLMPPRSGELREWQIQPKLLQHVEFRLDLLPQQTVISDHLTQKLGIVLGFGNSSNELADLVNGHDKHVQLSYK
jgi:biotin carboxylase